MMKKRNILMAVFLGTIMVLEACAAGNSGQNTEEENTTIENDATTYEVATVRWADWGEDYHTGFPDQAAMKKGITIKWQTILNSDWTDKRAVLLAGGNLPDAFMGSICFSELDILTNQGSFIALDDYIDEYMPNFKKIMDSDPIMKALAYSADGHIYGLPSRKPCRPVISNQMFINKKWLDNLGLSIPQTYKEFEDVLIAFKEQDANGNGDPTDEIPYGQGYADLVMSFCLPFGTTIGADGTYMMSIQNGEPIYLPTSQSYKDGISWMHECYEKGLIDPEIFTQDSSMRDAKLMNEIPIIGCAAGWTTDATFGQNADEYVALPALQGPDGNRYVASDPEHWNYSRYEFVVTKDCHDPGQLLSWADSFYTEDASIQNFYGAFGIGVEKDEETGTYTVLEPTDGNTADTFAWIESLRDFGPKYVQDDFNAKVTYAATDNGDASKLELDKELNQYARDAYPNVSYTIDQLKTLSTLYTDIDSYMNLYQATWVTEGGVEAQWDEYINTLEQMGYSEFLKIQLDAYETYESNK
ncbi:extracellular solute-binding protein [Butyrivibrio sp. LC3010]|uniref:extracellular solute-binding protein n=1 Tax=Butyrivibrio sp. LC3010 TaxID=1280680 RepID=UPI0005D25071|nr:extracellular solute-binding protein [Butyrivibrio sp. LC3010]